MHLNSACTVSSERPSLQASEYIEHSCDLKLVRPEKRSSTASTGTGPEEQCCQAADDDIQLLQLQPVPHRLVCPLFSEMCLFQAAMLIFAASAMWQPTPECTERQSRQAPRPLLRARRLSLLSRLAIAVPLRTLPVRSFRCCKRRSKHVRASRPSHPSSNMHGRPWRSAHAVFAVPPSLPACPSPLSAQSKLARP